MRFITDFHKNGKLTKEINSTFIALISKIDSPQKLNDFRPIYLWWEACIKFWRSFLLID